MKTRFLAILMVVLVLPALAHAQYDSPAAAEEDLSTVFNYLRYDDHLTSAGQVAYDQAVALKEAGYGMVVNLATVSEVGNALEGYLVAEQGITYVNIPVAWREPTLDDVELFFDVMRAAGDRKVFVHCAANMRASVFVYLYRTIVRGDDETSARADMETIWDPSGSEQWSALIDTVVSHYARTGQ